MTLHASYWIICDAAKCNAPFQWKPGVCCYPNAGELIGLAEEADWDNRGDIWYCPKCAAKADLKELEGNDERA